MYGLGSGVQKAAIAGSNQRSAHWASISGQPPGSKPTPGCYGVGAQFAGTAIPCYMNWLARPVSAPGASAPGARQRLETALGNQEPVVDGVDGCYGDVICKKVAGLKGWKDVYLTLCERMWL